MSLPIKQNTVIKNPYFEISSNWRKKPPHKMLLSHGGVGLGL